MTLTLMMKYDIIYMKGKGKMKKITDDTLYSIVDTLIDLYLGIYGCHEIEVLKAINEATGLTFNEIKEYFPALED